MSRNRIGMTGMDPQTGAALTESLEQANLELGDSWQLVDDQDADFVFVDMDSMYGPMSWIRLHADGKRVIGVTAAARTQADFHLSRPFDAASVRALLESIAPHAAAIAHEAAPAPASQVAAAPIAAPMAEAAATIPPVPVAEETASPAFEAPPVVVAAVATTTEPEPEPERAAAPPLQAMPEPAHARDPVFVDWMAPGAISGRSRYRRGEGPTLLIDADARQYHGPAALKPLADAISGSVRREDFVPVSATDWQAEAKAAGEAQPLMRLQWFAGLLAGSGILLAGHEPLGKYRLTKWPQTEREFPRHFRIATVMMKGPATLAEIAEGSGVSVAEATDFVNANLATGYAEAWREPEPEPEPQKTTGLFGRLRGR